MSLEMARQRVAKGVEWLDSKYPDWPVVVDPDTLNINDVKHCVLGQIALVKHPERVAFEDGFETMLTMYPDLTDDEAYGEAYDARTAHLGFDTDAPEVYAPELDEVWRDLIRERRLALSVEGPQT